MKKIQDAIDMVCVDEPLFANLMTRLKIIEGNAPTMGTDGEHLFYNPKFIEKLNEKEMCGVILHEVLHCAFQHQWRREDREPRKWNRACDYAINTIVTQHYPLPQGCLIDIKYDGWAAEEIYDQLPDTKEDGDQKGDGKGSGDGKGDQPGDGDSEQGWCDKDTWEGQGKDEKDKGLMDKIFGKNPPKGKMTPEERKEMWEKLHDETFVRNFGSMPQSIQRLIAKTMYVPVIDWASLIEQLLSEDSNDYTFATPDRRFLGGDFILPSLYSTDKLRDVVFAYDTSGSISEDDLKAFYEETVNLFQNFATLQGWIAVCDTAVHLFEEINTQQDQVDDVLSFVGGGGTSFRPVFEQIEQRNIRPKAVFYFTDTEGSFPEDPGYPVFWMVRTEIGQKYPVRVPFGTVIRFLAK